MPLDVDSLPPAAPADAVVAALPCVLIALDGAGRVTLWNAAAEAWLGLPASEVLGRPAGELPAAAGRAALLEAASAAAVRRLPPLALAGAEGSERYLQLEVASLPGGGVVAVGVDVTDTERRARAAEGRERVFSAMGHDLRTPITAMMGYSELLLDGIVGELSAEQQEMVGRISQLTEQLSQLLNDVLDLAKLEAGRLELQRERVPLAALLSEAVQGAEAKADARGVRLRVEAAGQGGAAVLADAARAQQVVARLLEHALRAGEAGEVCLQAEVEAGRVRLTVQRDGAVLPAGGAEALFNGLPASGGARPKQAAGQALGLTVARRLARAMGGELSATATPAGVALRLELPQG